MPSCSVVVCKNTSTKVNYAKDGISFHTYPKDPILKEKWINATGRGPNWFPTKNSKICSLHFEPKCFQPLKNIHRLFEWSEPTLKIRIVLANCTEPTEPSTSKTIGSDITAQSSPIIRADTNIDINPNCTMEHPETPRKLKLRRLISAQQSLIKKKNIQIKRLQKKTSRYKKIIANLKEILEHIKEKNDVSTNHVTHLENIGVTDLMQCYEKNMSSGQTTKMTKNATTKLSKRQVLSEYLHFTEQ